LDFNEKNKKSKLRVGDILLVQSGHIGHCAVVPEAHDGHNCHAMIVITPVEDVVSGAYLSVVFNTPAMQDAFQRIRTGSTVPHLTCKMVKELPIGVPPRALQDKIMGQVTEIKLRIEASRQRYVSDLANIDSLRQSLIQRAFAGRLT
jgi:type I restriction enzyme, S subunit